MNNDTTESFNRKIRSAQLDQYNFILVVGEKEAQAGTVNVRTRDNKVCSVVPSEISKCMVRLHCRCMAK